MSQSTAISQNTTLSNKIIPAAATALLGLGIIFSVAFMQGPNASVHNAAHDTRHALGIICH